MKKIDKGSNFLREHVTTFACPTCRETFATVTGHTIICPNQHQFDVNKKGSINFLSHAVNTEYDDQMLSSRHKVLQAGLFDGIIAAMADQVPTGTQTLLDIGTGEGSPLARLLDRRGNQDVGIGFDISKAGVNLATQLDTDAFFMVADLAKLPLSADSISTIVEFFSPSAYNEFDRVLQPGGTLLKVVPAAGYLHELRERLYPVGSDKHTYSNAEVVDRFQERYPATEIIPVRYTWDIPAELYLDLLHMTPLHWGARPEAQHEAEATPLTTITVDVVILKTTR